MKKYFYIILLIGGLFPGIILAGGFQLNEHGAKPMGLGGAFTAIANDASAVYWNGAGLSYMEGTNFLLGVALIAPSTSFRGVTPSIEKSTMKSQTFLPPHFFVTHKISNQFSAGLGVSVPFGLGTKWKEAWMGRYLAVETELQTISFPLVISWAIMENLSLSIGGSFSIAEAYLGTIGLLTALLLGLGFAYAHQHSASPWPLAWVALLLLLPASDVAIAVVQSLSVRFAAPRRLPRLDFLGGVPENARTMVVVPTLLTSVERVSELLEHLEVLALGNLDPRVHFAILSDFTDAPALEMPRDEAILSAARAGVEALNTRHAEGRSDRFYLVHRVRQWNPGEGVFMGWERKRGKIEEWNRFLARRRLPAPAPSRRCA